MNLDYYCYQESDNNYSLKIGGLSTVELLRLFNWSSEIEIKTFGATNYKKFGWATAQDIPSLKNVGEAILFLSNENEIGLIELECVIANFCLVETYQDSECSLSFSGRSECVDILKKIVPDDYCNYFVNFLLGNPNCFISLSGNGKISRITLPKHFAL
jgi:hypothetical protein